MAGDLRWDDVKQWFDPTENSSAPDVIGADTALADWQLILDLVRSHGWRCEYERAWLTPDRAAGQASPPECASPA